jgi:ribonuclease D
VKGTVDKSSQFTDWARRPLSTKQLEYARGDVTFLRKHLPHPAATSCRRRNRTRLDRRRARRPRRPRELLVRSETDAWKRQKIRKYK